MSYLNEFVAKIQKIDYPGFLTLWEEYCNSDQLDADELIAILDFLRKSDMAANLGRHIERILPLWETCQDKEKSYQVLKHLLDVQGVASEVLGEAALKVVQDRYGEVPRFQEKLKISGLKSRDKIQGCIRNFELLNQLVPGNFVLHPSGWGVGEIIDVSFLREEFTVEFELVAGKKTINFATAFKTLEPISKDHILAMRFSKPDDLEAFARKEPVVFMKKLLHELGPKTAAEIKDELSDLVIPSDEWTKWWQQTRAKLKKDSMIECPDDLKHPFRIRRVEFTHEERLKKLLSEAFDVPSISSVIYSFFRDFPESLKEAAVAHLAVNALLALIEKGDLSTSEEVMLYMLLDDLGHVEKNKALEDLIKNEQDFVPVFSAISIIALKKRSLVMVKALRHDWKMLFELLLLHIDYNPLRDYVFEELSHEGASKELHGFVHKLIAHPYDAPDAYIWLFQKGMEDESLLKEYNLTAPKLFESLLVLLARIESSSLLKTHVKKIVSLVMDDKFSLVRKVMKQASLAELKEYLLLSTKCQSFSDHELKIFQSLAEVADPRLAKTVKKQSLGDNPDIIWCTQEGFHRMQKRIQHIATVETVENAKEIEVARAHGDLRENAEFKAALERRDRLQQEMKTLSDQMGHARVISKDDINTDEVGIGCVIECLGDKGHKVIYKILGPWEADPDQQILSYQSKLAQTIGGKVKGEGFKFHDEDLVITDIRSYLE